MKLGVAVSVDPEDTIISTMLFDISAALLVCKLPELPSAMTFVTRSMWENEDGEPEAVGAVMLVSKINTVGGDILYREILYRLQRGWTSVYILGCRSVYNYTLSGTNSRLWLWARLAHSRGNMKMSHCLLFQIGMVMSCIKATIKLWIQSNG